MLDFNPFGKITDSLLFSWDELDNFEDSSQILIDERIDLRIVENELGVSSSQFSMYSQPIEAFQFDKCFDFSAFKKV